MTGLESIEELERRLAALKQQKAEADKPQPLPNPDFTTLQKMMFEHIEGLHARRMPNEDFDRWVYEAAVEACFGPKVWDWINKRF